MKILGIIPARGGSKGVPRKNIRLLCGKPLLQYTAEAALNSKLLSRVILSTEDKEIKQIGEKCGLEVPFLRPEKLAEDSTPTLLVIQHAVEYLAKENAVYDGICILQPTNPLRDPKDIDNAIKLFIEKQPDSVISILPVPHEYNPYWVYKKNIDDSLNLFVNTPEPISKRQDLPEFFYREGSIYIIKNKTLLDENSLYGNKTLGYFIKSDISINIDTEKDWQVAENYFNDRSSKKLPDV